MKYKIIIISYLIIHTMIECGDQNKLTESEKKIFSWFEETNEKILKTTNILNKITLINQQHIKNGNTDPDAIQQSRTEYIQQLCLIAKKKDLAVPYTEKSITDTIIKLTKQLHSETPQTIHDELTARTYVYNNLLQANQKAAVRGEYYESNKEKTIQHLNEWAKLLVEKLIHHNLMESSEREKKINELIKNKIDMFKNFYKNSSNS